MFVIVRHSVSALLITIMMCAAPAWAQSATDGTVLHAADAGKLLPDAVFFSGQSAPVQARNAGGIRFSDGKLVLAALIDTSGYSSAVQQKYQTYLIVERAIQIDGKTLPPGAYGAGFVSGHFGVMDIGNHDLFSVDATHDADLKRPMPLQVIADGAPGEFRLYQGRDFVTITAAHE